jgi:hypothetical protein
VSRSHDCLSGRPLREDLPRKLQGVPEEVLRALVHPPVDGSDAEAEAELEEQLWSFLPKECQQAWGQQAPHRMTSREAQVVAKGFFVGAARNGRKRIQFKVSPERTGNQENGTRGLLIFSGFTSR